MFSLKRRLYEALPGPLKLPFGWVPFGVLAGPAYRRVLRDGARVDGLERGALLAEQERALGRILQHAVAQVPAYSSYRGVVERLRPFEALRAFPLLTKGELQEDPERYLARDVHRRAHYEVTTGGTSGSQLRLTMDADSHAIETAFIHRQWSRVGYGPRSRKATFRGVSFPALPPGVYWQENPIYRELQFSPFHLSETTADTYLQALRLYRPDFLHGYPSALAYLAELLEQRGQRLGVPLRAVLLGSEGALLGQRSLIERVLGGRCFAWYGHSERVILAGECLAEPEVLHAFPDYGLLEVVDDTGQVLRDEGSVGELVGTGLWNHTMPLIRYRTDDRARLRQPRCRCGRHFDRFDQVEGRRGQDYVVGRTGARITLAALNLHGPAFGRTLRHQYVQEQAGALEVHVQPARGFGSADVAAIEAAFREKVAGELQVTVRVVEDFALTGRGKFRKLVRRCEPGATGARDT